jgi:peptidyl-prolyl cis-trans isomerase SurA
MTESRPRRVAQSGRCSFVVVTLLVLILNGARLQAAGEVADRVLARLNEDVILASDLREVLREKGMEGGGDPVAVASTEHVRALLDRTLLLQAAKKMGGSVPDAEILDQVESMVARIRSQYPSETEFRREVIAQYGSVEAFKRELQKKATLDWKIGRAIHSRFTITDADVARFEAECRAKGRIPESYHLRRLGVPVDSETSRGRQQALAQVKQILDDATARGLGFAETVRRFTLVPGERETAGDLGFIPAEQLAPDVRRAVQKLEPGQVTEPILAGNYASIFYLEAKRGPRSTLYEQRFLETRDKLLGELRKKARLQVFDPRLARKIPKEYAECVEPTVLAATSLATGARVVEGQNEDGASTNPAASESPSPTPSRAFPAKLFSRFQRN